MSLDPYTSDAESHSDAKSRSYAMACAKYGDCIFDEVQKGALRLDKAWDKITHRWSRLMDKAAKRGFLGLGGGSASWLNFVLFQPPRVWPQGLGAKQVKVLLLLQSLENYHQDIRSERLPDVYPSEEETLKAMQRLAALTKQEILLPMWRAYEAVSDEASKAIAPLCPAQFGEGCSLKEAKEIFKGDLLRGWEVGSLDVGPSFYKVYPRFKGYVTG